jgi:hypothetical protein
VVVKTIVVFSGLPTRCTSACTFHFRRIAELTLPMMPCRPRLAEMKPRAANPNGVVQLGSSRRLSVRPSEDPAIEVAHLATPSSPE